MVWLGLIIILGLVGWFLLPLADRKPQRVDLIDQQAKEKEANKQKIISALQSQDKITNDEVQKLLNVSDATATRYLDELEKENLVRQVGERGHQVYYEKRP